MQVGDQIFLSFLHILKCLLVEVFFDHILYTFDDLVFVTGF